MQVHELHERFREVEKALNKAQEETKTLKEALAAQEAWCARQELVKFAKNRRHEKSLLNFTRIIAGLPEWGWFHSRRECEKIVDKSIPAPPYQIFQLLVKITRSMKPLKLRNVEKKLRAELIHNTSYAALESYIVPNWDFLEESIRFCEGKDFKRSEIPYKIMGRFLYHLDRPKSNAETELAKLNRLY